MCCWRSNQVSQGAVIFKSDTGDPPHLRGVIMHQSLRCISKLPVMVFALGFIFPIKSANYMIILCTVPRPFWKRIVLVILFFYKDNSATGEAAYAARILMPPALSHTYSSAHSMSESTHTKINISHHSLLPKHPGFFLRCTNSFVFFVFFIILS